MLQPESLLVVYAFAFVVSLGAVVSPGPVSAAIVTEAPRQGWRVGPLVAVGHVFLELIVVVLISLGLKSRLATPSITQAIALGGGVVLLAMGASYLVGAWQGTLSLPDRDLAIPAQSRSGLLLLGVLTTLSNPYWYAWWVTVAAGYLGQSKTIGALAGPLVFYLGHVTADLTWDSGLAYATSVGGRWLNITGYKLLTVLAGGFMVYLGVAFIRTGLTG